MNTSIVRRILGYVLILEAAFMLLPCIVAIVYSESDGIYFAFVALLCCAVCVLMIIIKPENTIFYLK